MTRSRKLNGGRGLERRENYELVLGQIEFWGSKCQWNAAKACRCDGVAAFALYSAFATDATGAISTIEKAKRHTFIRKNGHLSITLMVYTRSMQARTRGLGAAASGLVLLIGSELRALAPYSWRWAPTW